MQKKRQEKCTPVTPAFWSQGQWLLWIWSQPGLYSKFEDSQGYIVRPCVMGYFDQTLTLLVLTIKFTLNQRVELATSWPELAIEVLKDPGHIERDPWIINRGLIRKEGLRKIHRPFLDGGRKERGVQWLFPPPFLWSIQFLPWYLIWRQLLAVIQSVLCPHFLPSRFLLHIPLPCVHFSGGSLPLPEACGLSLDQPACLDTCLQLLVCYCYWHCCTLSALGICKKLQVLSTQIMQCSSVPLPLQWAHGTSLAT